jgi:multidrug efflux pump subunit AcrA (membrane-fusion protein)
VRIHVDKKIGVLSLPIEAIVKESGKSFVQKVITGADGKQKTEKKEIKPGARNDREIEIVEGLAEGDRVLIKPASSAENEMKM